MRACFWIDAGPLIGGGHVTRAEALASALAPLGFESVLLADDPDAVRHAGSGHFEIAALASGGFAATCVERGARLAVVDLPHTRPAEPDALRALTDTAIPSVAFDSSDPTRRGCTLWVDAVAADAPGRVSTTPGLLGPRYAVLRRGLGPGREPEREPRGSAPLRVLVGFGAADPAGLTARALDALAAAGPRLSVDVLLGPLLEADQISAIESAARALPRVRLHRGVSDPLELLKRAQLGLFAFGNLFLEALACGVPSILWHPSAAHAEVARRFASHSDRPLAIDLGDATERASEPELRAAVIELIGDARRRDALSAAGPSTVDGLGAERVARAAARLVEA